MVTSVTEGRQAREEEIYTGFCERWRNLPKPTIAAVHGRCSTGGLMLCWPSDIIIAADDAVFEDVTVMLGTPGCGESVYSSVPVL